MKTILFLAFLLFNTSSFATDKTDQSLPAVCLLELEDSFTYLGFFLKKDKKDQVQVKIVGLNRWLQEEMDLGPARGTINVKKDSNIEIKFAIDEIPNTILINSNNLSLSIFGSTDQNGSVVVDHLNCLTQKEYEVALTLE